MKKVVRNIFIVFIVLLVLLIGIFVGRNFWTSKDQNNNGREKPKTSVITKEKRPSNVSKKNSTSDTKMLDNMTVSELKNNPKLSALAIVYYGANKINNTDWLGIKGNINNGLVISLVPVDTQTVKYYVQDNQSDKSPYYSLIGKNHDKVVFYESNDTELQTISMNDVCTYINTSFSRNDLNTISNKVTIKQGKATAVKSAGTNLAADAQSNSEKYASEIMTYADRNDIASKFSMPMMWNHLSDVENIYGGYFHLNYEDGEYSVDTQSGGGISFSVPHDGVVTFTAEPDAGPNTTSENEDIKVSEIELSLDGEKGGLDSVKVTDASSSKDDQDSDSSNQDENSDDSDSNEQDDDTNDNSQDDNSDNNDQNNDSDNQNDVDTNDDQNTSDN